MMAKTYYIDKDDHNENNVKTEEEHKKEQKQHDKKDHDSKDTKSKDTSHEKDNHDNESSDAKDSEHENASHEDTQAHSNSSHESKDMNVKQVSQDEGANDDGHTTYTVQQPQDMQSQEEGLPSTGSDMGVDPVAPISMGLGAGLVLFVVVRKITDWLDMRSG